MHCVLLVVTSMPLKDIKPWIPIVDMWLNGHWNSMGIEARKTSQWFCFAFYFQVSHKCWLHKFLFPLCYLESNVKLVEMALNNMHYECDMLLWHGTNGGEYIGLKILWLWTHGHHILKYYCETCGMFEIWTI